ncbi:sulfurtransferase TusA family protein [Carboxydothermus ferrireducens]|uniref:TusA-related sulfurtransferase n=1 Tax=Carboxydothermus ferrireducens DSM 11255 TaxID=1119529 RepID=A0ABX2RAK7_9THEO|nr:sulfurtransferase TusA family protein [Carboxydothermus ferrireducens]NYE57622.1 TusA-related sulfurtransferase [Carboxydothermus ferrireducens DSM 11255]
MEVIKTIDLREYVCPMTYVILQAEIVNLNSGDKIAAILAGKNTLADVTKSLKMDGHRVEKIEEEGEEIYKIVIALK